MHFGFTLDSWNIDLLDADLLDTDLLDNDLDSLVGHGLIHILVNILFISKTSSRHVLKRHQRNNFWSSKTSWRRLEDVLQISLKDVFKTSWRHLARHLEDAFKTFSRHICKTSSRSLGRRKIVTLKTCWRRLEDVFWRRLQHVSWRRFEDQQMFAGSVESRWVPKYLYNDVWLMRVPWVSMLNGAIMWNYTWR